MTIEEYFGDWCKVIDIQEADRIIKRLISLKQVICPKIKNIFKSFTLCSLYNLKILILGQDPYFTLKNNEPTATGIAFANTSDTSQRDFSPSLEVLMESVINFSLPHESIIFDPSLEKWEKQGVLMLNSALSCQVGKPGSHSLMWRPFIKSFLTNLSNHSTGIVYILMGTEAQSFEYCINHSYNYVFKTKPPSWYARNKIKMPSELWYKVNNILTGLYGHGIEWYSNNNNINKKEEDEEVFYEGLQ